MFLCYNCSLAPMIIHIIGSSHIAKQSVEEVTRAIETLKPDFVCLELDSDRLRSLFQNGDKSSFPLRKIGVMGWTFATVANWAERKLGKMVGLSPGAEMRAAVLVAREHHKKVVTIDQHILVTLNRLSRNLGWRERFRLVCDVIVGILFPKREMKALGLGSFDLRKVPSQQLILSLLSHVKVRYPTLYRILITERNQVMANNILTLHKKYPTSSLLVVVGAGHKEELEKLVSHNCQCAEALVKSG